MTHGFADVQKPLLVKGWLLPENRKFYRFKNKTFMLESLSMMLNMWVATVSERLKLKDDETIGGALSLIVEIDQKIMQKSQFEAGKWLIKLKSNDKFYIDYIHHLEKLIKDKILNGEHSKLNGIIHNTWEYEKWMLEAGHFMTSVRLINRIFHPLSETAIIDGEERMNTWMLASLMAGIVTKRDNDGNPEKVLTTLIQLGVINVETNYKLRLEVCQYLDSEYLLLINEIKEALDKTVQT